MVRREMLVAVGMLVAGAAPALAALQGENLLAAMPADFVTGAASRTGQLQAVEWIPKGETVNDWTRMVTVHVYHGARRADPVKVNTTMAGAWRNACPGGGAEPVAAATENGYRVSIWLFNCPRNPSSGKPETMWAKVISGSDSLYSVQYAVRSEGDVQAIVDAMNYLKRIAVCDTRRKQSPCPTGM